MDLAIRDTTTGDFPAVLALNLASEALLSPMDASRLVQLDATAACHRVAVAQAHQGRGLGAALYADLFAFARGQGIPRIVCEYYSVPLNDASRRFHARQGFEEVGTKWLPGSGKQVSFQLALV